MLHRGTEGFLHKRVPMDLAKSAAASVVTCRFLSLPSCDADNPGGGSTQTWEDAGVGVSGPLTSRSRAFGRLCVWSGRTMEVAWCAVSYAESTDGSRLVLPPSSQDELVAEYHVIYSRT